MSNPRVDDAITAAEDVAEKAEDRFQNALQNGTLAERARLRAARNSAFEAVAEARAAELERSISITQADIDEAQRLKKRVDDAADTEQFIIALFDFVGWIGGKFALI